jgi:hypothetical protein
MNPKDFFNNELNKKKSKSKPTKLSQLYKKPDREIGDNMPHFQYESPNYEQQADLLYLPNDGGYLYCLVVIDQGSRLIDCEPLKQRDSNTVLKALYKIWNRKIIKKCHVIRCDGGSEFNKDFQRGLYKDGIQVISSEPGRHRSQALVESRNKTIGTIIHKMLVQNKIAGFDSSKWKKYLPDLVDAINKKTKTVQNQLKTKPKSDVPVACEKGTKINLLNVGDHVRIALDNPQDLEGKRLFGKFRSSDIKWTPDVYVITDVLVCPNMPIMYKTNKDKHARTYQQLLKVRTNIEDQPILPIGDVEENRYEVEKLLNRKIENKKVYYLVKWKHYPKTKATWEDRKELLKDVPNLIKKYESKLN